MGARRTNLGLLVALVAALATGALAFAAGTWWGRPVVVGHGAAGLALLVLAPWKSLIVRRGLARRRPGRWASLAFGAAVVVAVAAGLAHATGALAGLGPLTAMQVHVGAALVAAPLLAWHAAARGVPLRRTDLSRRALLRAGAVGGGAGLLLLAVEGTTRLAGLPGGRRRFTGSLPVAGPQPARAGAAAGARGVDPDRIPVTQWLDDRVPAIDPAAWRLQIRAGGTSRSLTYQELAAFGDRVEAVLDCTGGWFARATWEGARLDRLLPAAGPGGSLVVVSRTGYRRRLPLADAAGLLLATRLQGRRLSPGHGFPARLVAPGRRGFWWVKWVTAVEVDDTPWWAQPPFPLT
jgi:DMSO/TMAO reductase YedYZ molybdopterin-dependent catalytic subunit